MPKQPNKIVVQKSLPHFVEEVSGLSVDDLNARLCQLAKDNTEVSESQEADEGLFEAQALSRELGAPYREAKRDIKLKSTFIVELIREKGGK